VGGKGSSPIRTTAKKGGLLNYTCFMGSSVVDPGPRFCSVPDPGYNNNKKEEGE
jgi:hypothetical protein